MKTMYVKPAPGHSVRIPGDPERHLPADGADVPASPFWLRRIADGSVEQATRPKGGK